ncbi:MAG: flotillin domain-containing protein [Pseudomonadota bacterium]
MNVFISIVVIVVAVAIAIAFLQRFYRKATRERALIRTGASGEKVVLDGGFLALPFLHKVEEINMRTMRLQIRRFGEKSLMTEDRLRLDAEMEFYLRVEPTAEGVATAAQSLGSRSLNPDELGNLFNGRFVDAMQSVVATKTMDQLHEDRGGFVKAVRAELAEGMISNGLRLESASLTHLDQASFASLDENNAFNAVGMRRLAEVVSSNKKKRAEIEADADVSVRQVQLDSLKRKLEIDEQQQQAEIAQTQSIEAARADSAAATELARLESQKKADQGKIETELETRRREIERDRDLRQHEVDALLAAESAKIESQIALAKKRADENEIIAETELSRESVIAAQEKVQSEKERLAAERERATALIKVQQQSQTSEERTKSEVQTLLDTAQAEAKASDMRAAAKRSELAAEAEGKAQLIKAENQLSPQVIAMKLDMHKMDRLPVLAAEMMKPMEKIDSIRINQVMGLGSTNGAQSAAGPIDGAVDSALKLALQMPAMKKIGKSVGLNFELDEKPAKQKSGGRTSQKRSPGKEN